MDETTFRILETLCSNLGKPLSIRGLAEEIKKRYGSSDYKNIYYKTQELKKRGIVILQEAGKSSIASLNFNSYLLVDTLAQVELMRKQSIMEKNAELMNLFNWAESLFQWGAISSISIIDAENNINLLWAEFLCIIIHRSHENTSKDRQSERKKSAQDAIIGIYHGMNGMQKVRGIKPEMKTNSLILTEQEFIALLNESQCNPVKEMPASHLAIISPQNYWITMKKASKGIQTGTCEEIDSARIPEQDIVYNLNRFGYIEIGSAIKHGKDICIESIITSIVIGGDARRIEAIPMMLSKAENSERQPIYRLLIFLCMKYEKPYNKLPSILLGLLKALYDIKKYEGCGQAIEILEALKIKPKKADEESIRQKMELYNG